MNPNDPIYEALTPQQKLKLLFAQGLSKATPQIAEPEPEPEEKGWSKAQLAGLAKVRELYAESRYPTWVVALLMVEREAQQPDPHTALADFAPGVEKDLYYGEAKVERNNTCCIACATKPQTESKGKRARRVEGKRPYIEFGEVVPVDTFPGLAWRAEEPLPEEMQAPPQLVGNGAQAFWLA